MSWRDKLKRGDESLKTPEHDALMLWLDENCLTIAKNLFPKLIEFSHAEWEKPLTSKNHSIICFIDLFMCGAEQIRKDYKQCYDLMFEVKPKIESIGELIRQIRSYEYYHRTSQQGYAGYNNSKIIVISPDTKAKDILLRHGFYFFNPDDLEVK